jgi:hypothetical protein
MSRLLIEFLPDRDRCGRLTLIDSAGRKICWGFAVAGRSTASLATAEGNPRRDPRLLYGDTPTGRYRLGRILKSGKGTFFPTAEFGPHGVAVLEAIAGDAALAEANGRFHVLLQGGRRAANGGLRTAAGALRLANDELCLLMAALRKADELSCEVMESDIKANLGFVFDDASFRGEDPAPLPRDEDGSVAIWAKSPSRRAALRAGAAGAAGLMALRLSVAFFALDAARPPSALAYGSSPSGSNTPPESPPAASNPPATPPATSTGTVTSPTLQQLQDLNTNGAVPGTQPYVDTPGPGSVQSSSPSDAKATYFQEMNDAGKITDPTAKNAAINAANTKYFSTINQPPAATLPTTSTTTVTAPAEPAGGSRTK